METHIDQKRPYLPLFGTRAPKRRLLFQFYVMSVSVAVSFTFAYRISYFPRESATGSLVWAGIFLSELWYVLYWALTLVARWRPVYRTTFKDRLADVSLPAVDVFVCTADPTIEPPTMVVDTVLSVMAYDYPPEKLSVYLSDDGGSDLTFYAMLEASRFAATWLPFCRKFGAEPRSPGAYFEEPTRNCGDDLILAEEWLYTKKLYQDMKMRIESAAKLGRISEEIRKQHKGFHEWNFVSSPRDHQTILQILIDGRDPEAVDIQAQHLPTLVYLAREKRPKYQHNFKAGAMNALIRVSGRISNSPIILNVDCDMYSNNSQSVRDALCFFMDAETHDLAYVQYPQKFHNLTKNDLYSSSLSVISKVEMAGFDGNGGPCYIGSGCFHRRDALSGHKYSKKYVADWHRKSERHNAELSLNALEDTCKVLASCTYEVNSQWGKEMGLKYGCPVEDIITGLAIQCRGWRSMCFNPERPGFTGLAPTTLLQALVQHKRWSEGDLQIFVSRYCPLTYGRNKIPLRLQLNYCVYLLWAANCLATLYYVLVPSLCLLKGVPLFPKVSSPWILPYAYVFLAGSAYNLHEFLWCDGTVQGWWNDQRMWMFKRTTAYFFAFIDNVLKLLGFTKSAFIITSKVADENVSKRYEQEIMEFGTTSPMFTIIGTIAILNVFTFVAGVRKVIMDKQTTVIDSLALQILLSGLLVLLNLPVYKGLFFRRDKGKMPTSEMYGSIMFAVLACSVAMY